MGIRRRGVLAALVSIGSSGCIGSIRGASDDVVRSGGLFEFVPRIESADTLPRAVVFDLIDDSPVGAVEVRNGGKVINSLPNPSFRRGPQLPVFPDSVLLSSQSPPVSPGEYTVRTISREEEPLTEQTWLFSPQPAVGDVSPPQPADYIPSLYPALTSPRITLTNLGSGPTRITDVRTDNVQIRGTTQSGADLSIPATQSQSLEIDNDRIRVTDDMSYPQPLPLGKSREITLDGFFADHGTGSDSLPSPISVTTDIVLVTTFGRQFRSRVSFSLGGEVITSPEGVSAWSRHHSQISIESVTPVTAEPVSSPLSEPRKID